MLQHILFYFLNFSFSTKAYISKTVYSWNQVSVLWALIVSYQTMSVKLKLLYWIIQHSFTAVTPQINWACVRPFRVEWDGAAWELKCCIESRSFRCFVPAEVFVSEEYWSGLSSYFAIFCEGCSLNWTDYLEHERAIFSELGQGGGRFLSFPLALSPLIFTYQGPDWRPWLFNELNRVSWYRAERKTCTCSGPFFRTRWYAPDLQRAVSLNNRSGGGLIWMSVQHGSELLTAAWSEKGTAEQRGAGVHVPCHLSTDPSSGKAADPAD